MSRLPVRAVCALLVLSSACQDGGGNGVAPPPPGATIGGTLTVAISRPGSIDPQDAFEPAGQLVAATMCEPLIQADPVTGVLRPALATSWLVSDGGRRIVLKLRSGVRFSDGSKVGVDDVMFSLSRAARADFAGHLAALFEPVAGFPEIHGEKEAGSDADRRRLAGVTAISNTSVEIQLRRPDADFLRLLTQPVAAPVPRGRAEGDPDGFARQPVCAGPYRLAGPWDPDAATIRLVRDPGYYGRNDGLSRGGAGFADTIDFVVTGDRGTEVDAYTAGRADVAPVAGPQVAQAKALGAAYHEGPGRGVELIGLPVGVPPFDRPAVRRALAAALDRRAIAATTPGRVAATGFLPPAAGDVSRRKACAATPSEGDAGAGALRALAAQPVRLYVNDELGNRTAAETVASQWQSAGVSTEVVGVPFDDLAAKAGQSPGVDGAFRFSWVAPFPSAEMYLGPLFHSNGIGRDNFSRFANPRFDRLLDRGARTAGDAADRRADYRRAEDLLCREMPMIPLTFDTARVLVRPGRIGSARSGLVTDRGSGLPLLRELTVTAPA